MLQKDSYAQVHGAWNVGTKKASLYVQDNDKQNVQVPKLYIHK